MNPQRDKNGLTEEEFLRQYSGDLYPKPSLTADIIVFKEAPGAANPKVLLIRRGGHPFLGRLALPGGFAEPGETIEQTAARELQEETHIAGLTLTLVGLYSTPGRDPRGWVVTAAFAAVIRNDETTAEAGDDADSLCWAEWKTDRDGVFSLTADGVEQAPDARGCLLAFDHDNILADAIKRIYGKTE